MKDGKSYSELKQIYSENFSMGYLNTDINSKFALISLICHITKKSKEKNPDSTCYNIIQALNKDNIIPDDFVKSLSIVCEDFMYGCTTFPTFNIKGSDMITTIRNILKTYIPF